MSRRIRRISPCKAGYAESLSNPTARSLSTLEALEAVFPIPLAVGGGGVFGWGVNLGAGVRRSPHRRRRIDSRALKEWEANPYRIHISPATSPHPGPWGAGVDTDGDRFPTRSAFKGKAPTCGLEGILLEASPRWMRWGAAIDRHPLALIGANG